MSRCVLLLWALAVSACFRGEIGPDAVIGCASGDDCPEDRVCLIQDGRGLCVPLADPCIVPDDGTASARSDGSACGEGMICVRQACVAPRCGDGVVSTGESCDGTDGCRPDCTACGDGVLHDGEECDNGSNNNDEQPGACRTTCMPATCGDGVRDPGEGCDDGEENSDLLADACRTTCARSSCGDGVLDDGEDCDDGALNGTVANACRPTCVPAACGDGVLDDGEECDNGSNNSDGQPGACRSTCQLPVCGDFVRDPGEECDDGEANSDVVPNACRSHCARPVCGDEVIDKDELCDDGPDNSSATDACRPTCVPAHCGDGVLDEEEECDNGSNNSDVQPGACRATCALATCGDLVRDPGEECDDGEANSDIDADACRSTCRSSSCGDGVLDQGEQCDDGDRNGTSANACRPNCEAAGCGDGILDDDEECDNGNNNSDGQPGACRTTCVTPTCGDFVRDPGEDCDQGSENSDRAADACRLTCRRAACGDGVVDDGEVCDDDNTVSGDGCRADCRKREECGDGLVDANEDCDDGNDNPRDGCDACRPQRWTTELFVTGSVEEREARRASVRPSGITVDPIGRIYLAEATNQRVRRLELDGSLTTIAGVGTRGFSGDGGPATNATLSTPTSVAVDPMGRIFIADQGNHRIRRIDLDGTITTVAGGGFLPPDGARALDAELFIARDVAFDRQGRLLIVDGSGCGLWRMESTGVLSAVVRECPLADTLAWQPRRVVVRPDGQLVVLADVTRIGPPALDGPMSVFGLTEVWRIDEDGAAFVLKEADPEGPPMGGDVAIDAHGRTVVAERERVSVLEADGSLTSLTADLSPFSYVAGLAVEASGGVLVADAGNARLSRIESGGFTLSGAGEITPLAGTGVARPSLDQSPASSIEFLPASSFYGVVADAQGRVIFSYPTGHRIYRVELDGTLSTLAGNGVAGNAGDGGPAVDAELNFPGTLAIDREGRLAFFDQGNARVRQIEVDGTVTGLWDERGSIAFDSQGRSLLARYDFPYTVSRRELDGQETVLFGSRCADDRDDPSCSFLGGFPQIACDHNDRIVLTTYAQIYSLSNDGSEQMTHVAGTGACLFSADPVPATEASLCAELQVAFAPDGRLVISDGVNHRIRRIESDGTLRTIAGNGERLHAGDGGSALHASYLELKAIAVDPTGRVVFVEPSANRIRRVERDGTMVTIAGAAHPVGPGQRHRARLYASEAMVALPTASSRQDAVDLISVGAFGRAVRVGDDGVGVVMGYESSAATAQGQAAYAPLLQGARGVALDPLALRLLVTEHDSGRLRVIGLDGDGDRFVDESSAWTHTTVDTDLVGPSGIAYQPFEDVFLVVDEDDHCVRRVDVDGVVQETQYGRCGTAGTFPGYLNRPTHVAVSNRTGAVYIADTGNNRVLRVAYGSAQLVLGDGSVSSAGEGSPARRFPVHAPRQVALDALGNLYVASTTTVRLVANVDGDQDADGDDRVFTIFGGGDRTTFPESDAFCIHSLALDDTGRVYAADACQGFVVELTTDLMQE
jgi:cysteine-rich repeat protein